MKRMIRSNYYETGGDANQYPKYIEIHELSNKRNIWKKYKKLYEHEGGGCYYTAVDEYTPVTSWISIYPDGHVTYLWDGRESEYRAEWRPAR